MAKHFLKMAIRAVLSIHRPGSEAETRRANVKEVAGREETYIRTMPVPPPPPVAPPPDTPCDMMDGAARALAFERATGSCAIGACSLCRETRLGASYFRGGKEDEIPRRHHVGKQGLFTKKITLSRSGGARRGSLITTSRSLFQD